MKPTRPSSKGVTRVANTYEPTRHLEYYEPIFYSFSKVFKSYVKLFIKDVHALELLPQFQVAGVRFYLNHPIKFVSIVGIVIGIIIREKYSLIAVDDSSGSTIDLRVEKEKYKHLVDQCEDADVGPYKVGTIVKSNGIIMDHFGIRQLAIESLHVVSDLDAEVKAWQVRLEYKQTVLSQPWVVSEEIKNQLFAIKAAEEAASSEKAPGNSGKRKTSSKGTGLQANVNAMRKEAEAARRRYSFTSLPQEHHTLRSLKLLLLQYFKEADIRDFTISTLRAEPEIEEATRLVVTRLEASDPGGLRGSGRSEKVRSCLDLTLRELIKDGNIINTSLATGAYFTIGYWNLAPLIKDACTTARKKKKTKAGVVGQVNARDIWMKAKNQGGGWEDVPKAVVAGIVAEAVEKEEGWALVRQGVWMWVGC
ncbi:hypothetical protein YB2330_003290 [Saitoella coloradoensis]